MDTQTKKYTAKKSVLRYKADKEVRELYKSVQQSEEAWKAELKEVLGSYSMSSLESKLHEVEILQKNIMNLEYLKLDYKSIMFKDYLLRNA